MLPFSLWESCGLAMIPVAALVAFLLLGVEEIGVQIEEVSGASFLQRADQTLRMAALQAALLLRAALASRAACSLP